MEPVFEPLSYAPKLDRDRLLREIEAAVAAQNLSRAAKLARSGLDAGFEHPGLLTLVAHRSQAEGRSEEALALLERARRLAPRDVNVLNATAFCLAALGRDAEAMQTYEAAVAAEPRFAPPHAGKAELHEKLGQIAAAIAGYETAVGLGLNDPGLFGRRAWLAAESGDAAVARSWATRALAADPSQPTARLALARAQFLDGDFAGARASLDRGGVAAWSPANRAHAAGLEGDAFDAEGDPVRAFERYAAANIDTYRLFGQEYLLTINHDPAMFMGWLIHHFEHAAAADWAPRPAPASANGPRTHVFLIGFPRSGMSVIEQGLEARADAVTLADASTLSDVEDAFFIPPDGMDRLARVGDEEIERLRALYWARVRGLGADPKGRLFVDRTPTAAVLLPAIARLFPRAKILFARRDPRDVVFSCFRHRFGANPTTFPFLNLESAGRHYGGLMRLLDAYRQVLPLDLREVRYEQLAADAEAEMAAVIAFLGVDPAPGAGPFTGASPDSAGKWRRYRDQLTPVLPSLEPWVEKYGYAPTGES